ncbi:hypothetical protein EDD17DRAFT_1762819 [Pisolithus thermaeus]|nr:hypothetical protein EV401DRAFT_2079640 [Pisolithus croceorrhizus]KAI6159093.1 hypothetical protein EDD17DRAFT_1762819 [Pisolithus thermaeus]
MSIAGGFGEALSEPDIVQLSELFAIGSILVGGLVSAVLYGTATLQERFKRTAAQCFTCDI